MAMKLMTVRSVLERHRETFLGEDLSIFWNKTDWHLGDYGMGQGEYFLWFRGNEGATYSTAKVEPMALQKVLQASGLWNERITPENLEAVRAFIQRPWVGICDLDDICKHSAKYDIDPEHLVNLAEAAGELDTEEWL